MSLVPLVTVTESSSFNSEGPTPALDGAVEAHLQVGVDVVVDEREVHLEQLEQLRGGDVLEEAHCVARHHVRVQRVDHDRTGMKMVNVPKCLHLRTATRYKLTGCAHLQIAVRGHNMLHSQVSNLQFLLLD